MDLPILRISTRAVCKIARAPVVAALLLLEPVVNVICGVMMVFGLVTAFAFEMSSVGHRFPFVSAVVVSLAFGLFLLVYHSTLALLVRD
jgi:hypothetical protein